MKIKREDKRIRRQKQDIKKDFLKRGKREE
jgi:hypothetical protein